MENRVIDRKYMDWLEKFCCKYSRFYSDDFDFNSELSDYDKDNINNLYNLYNIVKKYAKDYLVLNNKNSDVIKFYELKYNDFYYKIGYIFDNIYCEKKMCREYKYIDFDDIVDYQNKENDNKDKIDYLKNVLKELLENGIAPRVIEEETKK